MKERAKLYRPQTERKTHTISKRLKIGAMHSGASQSHQQPKNKPPGNFDGQSQQMAPPKQQDTNMKPPGK